MWVWVGERGPNLAPVLSRRSAHTMALRVRAAGRASGARASVSGGARESLIYGWSHADARLAVQKRPECRSQGAFAG